MIRIKIRELAEEKGIDNPFQLMKVTGLNYAQCHFYWNSEAKQIGIDALNRVCMALGVTPGQIFEFEADPDWSSDKTVALRKEVKEFKRKQTGRQQKKVTAKSKRRGS